MASTHRPRASRLPFASLPLAAAYVPAAAAVAVAVAVASGACGKEFTARPPDASTSSSTGGGSGGDGGSGGGALQAEAELVELNSSGLSGTATFAQSGEEVTLTITVSGCPAGEHSAHIHENKSCEENGNAAGAHWIPNGEGLGSFTCDDAGQGTHTVKRGTDVWTVGGDPATDVTKYSIVVHAAADPNAGGRIGCGLIELE
ncbi:hypothetical protein BE21_05395 [Sorangium cellulosum]|uniref:Superoxide dismutase copper/zinc binding domain-containing protein n=1 Tax=Sorangium cellulosum TaxID=56 RepID=A0A150TCB1_SORCE|nr:hypothetical protein BE21_05395 [Sorangium cellulosum]